jgi:thymidylate synthase (FAD)
MVLPDDAVPVLNEGFLRLVDVMGDDNSVVRAARVSYGEESKGEDADKRLINYMMEHDHGTPFEHINFTFHIKCPLFVARQWMRHRIGSFNEISGRYVKLSDSCYYPDAWRANVNPRNKQDSTSHDWGHDLELIEEIFNDHIQKSLETYHKLLDFGVAREQARTVLPLATYTEFYWTVNARSLFNFIRLRISADAQKEIRDYAEVLLEIGEETAPWSFAAFKRKYLTTS